MYKFKKNIFINRSQQDVFDFLSNPDNLTKWVPVTESVEWISKGKPDVGATFKVVANMRGGKTEGLFEITNWDPPNRYSYKSVKLSFPGTMESIFTLAPKDNGTQVTFEGQIAITGILKFAERMLGKRAEKRDEGNIETMKQLLESA